MNSPLRGRITPSLTLYRYTHVRGRFESTHKGHGEMIFTSLPDLHWDSLFRGTLALGRSLGSVPRVSLSGALYLAFLQQGFTGLNTHRADFG